MEREESALAGVRVLDVTRVLAGPHCGAILADLGAEVIKIEQPNSGDDARQFNPFVKGESSYFMNLNRGKKGVTLDLKKGKQVFLQMVAKSDIVIENFKPGTMAKLGLDYEALKKVNPGIIFVSISGFGQSGPYHLMPGYDLIGQAMSGLMSVTGEPGREPLRAGGPMCDVMGGMSGAMAALAALQYRNRTGKGQMIDISLLDALVASMMTINHHYLVDGRIPQRRGNAYESAAPADSFRAADGYYVVTIGNDKLWRALVDLMKLPQLLEMEEFSTNFKRVQNAKQLKKHIEAWSSALTVGEVVKSMLDVGIAAAPILDIKQVCTDPHIAGARGMFVEVDHPTAGKVRITNSALRLSETNAHVRGPSPTLGEHNEAVYGTVFGFAPEDIAAWKEVGVI
ncbi:CoA transferase [Oleispirillum naphthae]|uniref:CaiB/BaiF CoA transferase family protein n=1 Tax=Oleispirillum naphthae TaxID=2838853 RepID=UPI0030822AB1